MPKNGVETTNGPVTLQHEDENRDHCPCDNDSIRPGGIRASSFALDAASDAETTRIRRVSKAEMNADMKAAEELGTSATPEDPTDESHLEDDSSSRPSNKPAASYVNSELQGTAHLSLSPSQISNPQPSSSFIAPNEREENNSNHNSSCSHRWTRGVQSLQKPIQRGITRTALHAAGHSKLYCSVIVVLSFTLAVTGFLTNFFLEYREAELWTPRGSLPAQHDQWIEEVWNGRSGESKMVPAESGGSILLLVHAHGANVITKEGMAKNFEALDRVRSTTGYNEHCAQHGQLPCPSFISDFVCLLYGIPVGSGATRVCNIAGVSGFWFHETSSFEKFAKTDQDVRATMSIDIFPGDEENFDLNNFVGYPEFQRVNGTELLMAGRSYLTVMSVPPPGKPLESAMVDEVLQLRDEWTEAASDNAYHVEVIGAHSSSIESTRTIYENLPLIPVVATLMSGFTAIVFFKRDWLHSQTLLGVGAVVCITMSLLSGYGVSP